MSKKSCLEFVEVFDSQKLSVPVVLIMSGDKYFDPYVAMKGVRLGACDILIKPLSSEKAQFLWQHSYRRMDNSKPNKKTIPAARTEGEQMQERKLLKWSPALEEKFLGVVNQLGGFKDAKPKAILRLMGDCGLKAQQITTRLQKYRKSLKTNQAKASTSRAETQGLQASHDFSMPPIADMNNISSPASMYAPLAYADGLHPPIAYSDGFQYNTWKEMQNIDMGNYYLTYDVNENVEQFQRI